MSDESGTTGARAERVGELRIVAGPLAGRMFALPDGAVLGRETDVEIVLEDPSGETSRRHARIARREGEVVVEDLGSMNGTFVNDERIDGTRVLRSGDRIRIGRSTLEFSGLPPASPPQATAARPIIDPQATRERPIIAPQTTRERPIIDPQTTRERPIIDPQTTRERPIIAPQTTRERPIIAPQTTRERPIVAPQVTRVGAGPPLDPAPTFAPPGSDGQLRVIAGPGTGRTVRVFAGSATIGREPECDLQVLDGEVSRRHAKVTIRDGVATVDDLHSVNGTYVNGERILEPFTLAPRDRIQIGEAAIELTSPVFEDVAERPPEVQVSGYRDVIAHTPELLSSESSSRKWWTLAAVLITTFMLLLDVTIVAVALPTISSSLHPGFTSLQWIVDAYTLMLTVALLAAGSMADLFGRKRALTIGLVIFTLASVLCAQAWNATALDLARGLQGLGGAIMFACSVALIVQEFPAEQRGVAFGLYGATNGLSVALGPILGGLLVQGIGWQAIFYVNVPIGIVAFVILQRKIVNLPGWKRPIDWPGLFTFSAMMLLAVFATIRGNDDGWTSSEILGCYAAAAALLVAFVVIELRTEMPLFDLSLFRKTTFLGSSIGAITICFSVLGLIFFLTTWLQTVLGFSAIGAGLRMLPFSGMCLLIGPLAGRLSGGGRISPRVTMTVSLALAAGGIASMTVVSGSSAWTAILPGLIIAGIGLGLINPTLSSTAVGVVPLWRAGMAGGMNSTAREFGTTAGIAVYGTLLQHQVMTHVSSTVAHTALASRGGTIANAIAVGGTPRLLTQSPAHYHAQLLHLAHVSYAAGLRHVFVVGAVIAGLGAIASLLLVRQGQLHQSDAPGGH